MTMVKQDHRWNPSLSSLGRPGLGADGAPVVMVVAVADVAKQRASQKCPARGFAGVTLVLCGWGTGCRFWGWVALLGLSLGSVVPRLGSALCIKRCNM